ncbi:MAG: ABC transporter ATP-binding protein [Lachnospira sp.]|nr:ABC transporter ATP-binding protein [Lachnospira sp.]
MLQLNHIKKMIDGNEVLSDIYYVFEEGRLYSVLAGSKEGKTVLLKCINKDYKLDSGVIKGRVNQVSLYVSDEDVLPEYVTGEDFITYLCQLKKGSKKPVTYMDKVALNRNVRRKFIKEYNVEDKVRLFLAMYLIQKPHVMLFDDVLDTCSDSFVQEFFDIISEECSRRIVIVTTGRLDIARFLSDDILLLNKGELNEVSGDMLDAPEIKQAIADILGEDANDNY